MTQIGLPFDWRDQAQPGQFIVSDANAFAMRHIEAWQGWPVPISILTGPARSGKSTLGRHFVALSGGTVIDDAPSLDNAFLFHAWNMARDSGTPLLLIARDVPESWPVTLPDLKSRLAAAPHVRIAEPDDALVRALIETGLAQAGSAFAPDLSEWLARRIDRTYEAVAGLLVHLNRLSLASSRKISVALAKEALQNLRFLHIEDGDAASDAAHGQDRKSADNG